MALIDDYKVELAYANRLKREGVTYVSRMVAGETLAAGRLEVPIDEYIKRWQDGVTALENGAPEEDYNY